MELKPGWINRQFARVERESKNWPEWMRRETEIRAQELRRKSELDGARSGREQTPAEKKSGGA